MNRLRTATAAALMILVVVGVTPVAASSAPPVDPTRRIGAEVMPAATAVPPTALNLYVSSGFRYQDPNLYACTSTNVMNMLNFVALKGTGGTGFRWKVNLTAASRDSILAWERQNDTLMGGNGSDPHGWRNALNLYGWGSATLWAGSRVYDDISFSSYDYAVKASVRALIRYRKPVGILAWAGRHAQVLTGYYGLVGDPFAKDAAGKYTNAFSVGGFYLSDPLKSQAMPNIKVGYATLKGTSNLRLRFRPYTETDSPYDDKYTAGYRRAVDEWYGRFVIVAPVR